MSRTTLLRPLLTATLVTGGALAVACTVDGRESTTDSPTSASSVSISASASASGLTNSGSNSGSSDATLTSATESMSGSGTTDSSSSATDGTSNSSDPSTVSDSATTSSAECTDDTDCPDGQVCSWVEGVCIAEGTCFWDQDCDEGQVCQDGMCVIGGDCGAQAFGFDPVPPNLMIVLDRSGSMDGDVQNSNKSRWEVAKDAIKTVTQAFDNDIRFGLVTFSACILFNECSPGEIIEPPAPNNAAAINGFLQPKGLLYLCNSGNPETSTGNTLDALIGYPLLQDPTRTNAILLLTDGNENSECQDTTNAAQAAAELYAQQFPVRTFAVGFSDNIIGSLANVAMNGGTGMPYNATNPAELEAALAAIAQTIASCDFILDDVPPDPDAMYVFFNDVLPGIPNDPVNGWTYDPNTNTLHFHGDACAQIQGGEVDDIDVVYGCNMPVPE